MGLIERFVEFIVGVVVVIVVLYVIYYALAVHGEAFGAALGDMIHGAIAFVQGVLSHAVR